MGKAIYSDAQKEFVGKLITKEKCTVGMVYELTGIPRGSIGGIAIEVGASFPHKKGGGRTQRDKIHHAVRVQKLREKYAKKLEELFPKPAAQE